MANSTPSAPESPGKLLLWIDGVGGYLICLKPRVSLGQAGRETTPDLAILAAIARHHATIQRDAEGYILEAVRSTALNGQAAAKAFLRSGDRLTLGSACQLVFSQPVPISASARLDLVSGQRWQQPVSAVLLMAETLVIGPGPQAHVVIDELQQPVVLFRPRQQGLAIRYAGNLVIGGRECRERGALVPGARVTADGVSFALEDAG